MILEKKINKIYINFVLLYVLYFTNGLYVSTYKYFVRFKVIGYIIIILEF
jgi:hypothetical protein